MIVAAHEGHGEIMIALGGTDRDREDFEGVGHWGYYYREWEKREEGLEWTQRQLPGIHATSDGVTRAYINIRS